MYRIIRTIAALSLSLLATQALAQGDEEWTTLIEGNQGLDNFTQVGDANWHSASDFIHVNRGEGVAYLVTPDSYDDFELHVEFMASEDANSGIYMRCQDARNITDRSCYEANIYDQRPDPSYGTGAIVHVAPVSEPYPKVAGQWNTYEITLQGERLQVVLNGEETVDVQDSQFSEGPIALQWGRGDLRFRSFRIRPLSNNVMAAPQGWSPLLEPSELATILERSDDVRVVRLTGDYESGHIPGAVSIPYSGFRGPQSNPGQLPDLSDLTQLLQQAGIDADTPVVLVHQGNSAVDMGAATRVYWTLRSLGVEDLAVLNGGFSAWQSAQLPVSMDDVMVPASGYEPRWNDQWQVTTAELEGIVDNGTAVRLVDARPEPYFLGQQASAPRAGTIPGSENLSFTGWFDGSRMKNEDELSAMLATDANTGHGAATFCNTGHLGSINWFVMNELAGLEGTRLYAESVTEWAQAPERPMENEPRDGQ